MELLQMLLYVAGITLVCLWPVMVIVAGLFVPVEDKRYLTVYRNKKWNKLGHIAITPYIWYVNSAVNVGMFLKLKTLWQFLFYKKD